MERDSYKSKEEILCDKLNTFWFQPKKINMQKKEIEFSLQFHAASFLAMNCERHEYRTQLISHQNHISKQQKLIISSILLLLCT